MLLLSWRLLAGSKLRDLPPLLIPPLLPLLWIRCAKQPSSLHWANGFLLSERKETEDERSRKKRLALSWCSHRAGTFLLFLSPADAEQMSAPGVWNVGPSLSLACLWGVWVGGEADIFNPQLPMVLGMDAEVVMTWVCSLFVRMLLNFSWFDQALPWGGSAVTNHSGLGYTEDYSDPMKNQKVNLDAWCWAAENELFTPITAAEQHFVVLWWKRDIFVEDYSFSAFWK